MEAKAEESTSEVKEESDALVEQVANLSIKGNSHRQKKGRHNSVKALIRRLHARNQLTERVHVAVVRNHTEEGFVVDVIVYDTSNEKPVLHPYSNQHDKRIPPQSLSSLSGHIKESPRYVLPAIIKWKKFPHSIQNTPLEHRIQGSKEYFPVYSIVNVRFFLIYLK